MTGTDEPDDRADFRAWMARVDEFVEDECGLGVSDLADAPFADWYSDGIDPAEAAILLLQENDYPFEED